MKKSLVALAVLAASGAAMAQSSVTLYGKVDAWLGSEKTGVGAAELTQTKINSATLNGSRWGVMGTEDLGGGLSAKFQLEQGFTVDDGNGNSARAFHRQAWVGLSGGFGTVGLGRQYSPYDDVHGAADVNSDSTISPMGAVAGLGTLPDYNSRIDSSIKFQSNNYSGFSAAALVGLGENKTASVSASQTTAFNVQYGSGPVWATLAYQEQKDQIGTPVSGTATTKYTLVGGSYDFGVAKARLIYEEAKRDSLKDKDWTIGADIPVSKAALLTVGYTKGTGSAPGVADLSGKGFTIQGQYNLSTRTAVYAGIYDVKQDQAGVDLNKTSGYRVGLRHSF